MTQGKKNNKTKNKSKTNFCIWGWKENVKLLDLQLPTIKAKVDTGAKKSTLHAVNIESFTKNNKKWVKFITQPFQNSKKSVECICPLHSKTYVTDSGGHTEYRYVIKTKVKIGTAEFITPVTLTNRSKMTYRMLIGRSAIRGRALVNCSSAFIAK